MQAIGGIMAAWEIWEKAMVPSLLSGAGTWMGITSTEIERLDKIQELFWRVMLRVPESCPRIALRAETRMIGMKHRVWQEKLLLVKRIKAQSKESLSRKVFEEQKANKWPGLSREVMDICEAVKLPDINDNEISAGVIKKAVLDHHHDELMDKISNSKKMKSHKDDNFREVQGYMKGKSVENCRMAFRIRCEMVEDIRGNYKDKHRRKGGETAVLCQECSAEEIETQAHCLECPRWESLKSGLELDKIEDLVIFFQKLMMERMKDTTGSQGAAQVS